MRCSVFTFTYFFDYEYHECRRRSAAPPSDPSYLSSPLYSAFLTDYPSLFSTELNGRFFRKY